MSEKYSRNFREKLVEHGYRVTKARQDTFQLLMSPKPQSMNELLKKAKGKVDRVSVYRSVDVFEKIGIVQRIYVGWKYKLELSDDFMQHHHHITCLSCGLVLDIKEEQSIKEFISSITNAYNFKPRHHQFEISGYCENCKHYAV